jgi:hypothetical protein
MDNLFYWTGVATWVCIIFVLGKWIVPDAWGAAHFVWRQARYERLRFRYWWRLILLWWDAFIEKPDSVHYKNGRVIYWPGKEPR